MPDCACKGTGFVKNGDYFDRRGNTHRHIPSVKRCPSYTEYFKSVADPLDATVIRGPGVCGAAADRHEYIKMVGERKDDKKGRGRF
jgi:hypothetical protein